MRVRVAAGVAVGLVVVAGCGSTTQTPEQIRQSLNAEAKASAGANGPEGSSSDGGGSRIDLPSRRPYHFDGHGANVSASRFGKKWPLTVESGRVNCLPIETGSNLVMVIFTANNGDRYAVNGIARSPSRMADFGLKDIYRIWAPNPKIPGTKKDIGPLIDVCAPLMK